MTRALILAAGLGTRLRPLTETCPKPLVPVAGRPMIHYALDSLLAAGIQEILVNVHYLGEQLIAFAASESKARGLKIEIQDERDKLLGSGGAIQKAAPWLFAGGREHALILNSDTLLRADLGKFLAAHEKLAMSGKECTLMVMASPEAGRRYTGLDVAGDEVRAFIKPDPKAKGAFMHFPGVYALAKASSRFLSGKLEDFSIVERMWKPLAQEGKLGAWHYSGPYQDLGSVDDLKLAAMRIKAGDFR